jgi:hypothetical protein
MLRRMIPTDQKDEHFTREHVHLTFKMPTISTFITTKRMRWIGHALRRSEQDNSRIAVLSALENKNNVWTKLVIQDCKQLKMDFNELDGLAQDRPNYHQLTRMMPTTNSGYG